MVKLTDDLIEAFNALRIIPLATADKDGVPNVAPMGAKTLADPETILVMDNFMQKTVANIRENPKAAIYVWGEGVKGCFQIHGDVTYVNEGEQFEAFRKETLARKPNLPAKGMLVIKITDVYTCNPGASAGDKIV